MKKILYILFALPFVLMAQDTNKNYVKSITYKKEFTETEITNDDPTDDEKVESVTYFDGLGRPIQSVNQRAGGNKEDIITHIEYDAFGRQTKDYLPYAVSTNSDGFYIPTAEVDLLNFYNTAKYENTLNPFSEKDIENSQLGRVFEQAAPGDDWKLINASDSDHTIKFEYETNATDEVKLFEVTFDNDDSEKPILTLVGYYPENELYKNTVKDENWQTGDNWLHTTEEFKDKHGRVILKRTYADVGGSTHDENKHDTYYVYDVFGNLTYVIPPLAAETVFDENTTSGTITPNITTFPCTDLVNGSCTGDMTVAIKDLLDGTYEYKITLNIVMSGGGYLDTNANIQLPEGGDVPDLLWFTIEEELFPSNTYTFNSVNGVLQITNTGNTFPIALISKNRAKILIPGTTTSSTLNTNILDDLCYQYKYDKRNRLIEKKIPGKDWESIVYNLLDLPIMTQDAEQDNSDIWLVTKYDAYGRVAYTGIKNSSSSRTYFQGLANGTNYARYEERLDSGITIGNKNIDYTKNATPVNMNQILTVNYYDDYKWLKSTGLEASYYLILNEDNYFSQSPNDPFLTKLNSSNSFNAGFTSGKTIQNDGYIQYTVTQTDSQRVYVGLSDETNDTNQDYLDPHYSNIDYAIYTGGTSNDKKVRIYEEGVNRGIGYTIYYDVGDTFRVERSGDQILYKKNGETFYVSQSPTTATLIGDGSFAESGTSIKNVHIGFSVMGQEITENVKGLSTGTEVNILGETDYTLNRTHYDIKGRPIYVTSTNNYLGTNDVVNSKLDFVGKTVLSKATHVKGHNNAILIKDEFQYDHADRLSRQEQQVNDGDKELIAHNFYDELGQLKSKNIGGSIPLLSSTTNEVNVAVNGSIIEKTGGTQNVWDAGLSTTEHISGDGYVSFSLVRNVQSMMVGLSYSDINQHWVSTDYTIYAKYNGQIGVKEKNLDKGLFGTYMPGDVFKVERKNNIIYYSKNGEVFYTSTKVSNGQPMIGDVSMAVITSKIKNFVLVDTEKALQTVDYNYNIRGWLKNINDVDNLGNDLFAFGINYNEGAVGSLSAPKLYNGNIGLTQWKTANDNIKRGSNYYYDALNRIEQSNTKIGVNLDTESGRYHLYDVNYDKNGNILGLKRNGHIVTDPDKNTTSDWGQMDKLTYFYNGNQLHSVSDEKTWATGFVDGNISDGNYLTKADNDYDYDSNGNMLEDKNKGITGITYNHLNLPTSVGFSGIYSAISYVYDATGNKLQKTLSGQGISTVTTTYAGNFIYEENFGSTEELKFFNHPEGYIEPDGSGGFEYTYQYKDHLGNIRLSYIKDQAASMIVNDDFDTNTGNWSHPSTQGSSIDNNNDELNINLINKWNSTNLYLDINPNEPVYIKFDFDKGDMEKPVLFVREKINGVWEPGADRDSFILEDGHFQTTLNLTGDHIRVYFEKGTGTDDGYTTTCYVDNFKLEQNVLQIKEENNYYPFGLKHKGYNNVVNGTDHPYGYNGKEENEELGLGWHHYGARFYDASLSRFMSIDPKAETYSYQTTYSYAVNNPIYFIDRNGEGPWNPVSGIGEGIARAFTSTVNDITATVNNTIDNVKTSVVETAKNVQTFVKENKETIVEIAQGVQTVGEVVEVVGVVVAVAGGIAVPVAGAAPGLKIAAVGGAINTVGAVTELATEVISADLEGTTNVVKDELVDFAFEKVIDLAVPGPNPDLPQEVTDVTKAALKITSKPAKESIKERID